MLDPAGLTYEELLFMLALYRQVKADAAWLRARWEEYVAETVWRPGTGVVRIGQIPLVVIE